MREDAVNGRSPVQTARPDHLEHLPAYEPADRPACGLSVDAGPASQVGERRSGGAVPPRVAVEGEPDRQLAPAQADHAGIDEGVQDLEAKFRATLRGLPPR